MKNLIEDIDIYYKFCIASTFTIENLIEKYKTSPTFVEYRKQISRLLEDTTICNAYIESFIDRLSKKESSSELDDFKSQLDSYILMGIFESQGNILQIANNSMLDALFNKLSQVHYSGEIMLNNKYSEIHNAIYTWKNESYDSKLLKEDKKNYATNITNNICILYNTVFSKQIENDLKLYLFKTINDIDYEIQDITNKYMEEISNNIRKDMVSVMRDSEQSGYY